MSKPALAYIGVGLIAVTFNTVRQHVLAQAEEIDVCRLLGATTAYVRRPYLYLGAALGLVGGIVATGLAFGAMRWLNAEVQALAALYGIEFSLVPPEPGTVLLGALVPAILGLVGAAISVSYYLHQHFD